MKFGLTQTFTCSYLADHEEQLLVYVDQDNESLKHQYGVLISAGFRRSGDQIYRPQCPSCQACQSIRIPVDMFTPSKSQSRVMRKNQDIRVFPSLTDKPEYYDIYEAYINHRHSDGSMYPASKQQYASFMKSDWMRPHFLECYLGGELIAVAVTDEVNNGFSAMYTFYNPEYESRSIGIFAIISQIKYTLLANKSFLYLGYQVDECAKMNYKSKFLPHQRFLDNKWQLFTKKEA